MPDTQILGHVMHTLWVCIKSPKKIVSGQHQDVSNHLVQELGSQGKKKADNAFCNKDPLLI
jgi:hypothetical protein